MACSVFLEWSSWYIGASLDGTLRILDAVALDGFGYSRPCAGFGRTDLGGKMHIVAYNTR